MSQIDQYPAGVPCWVETFQPEPRAALQFCASLFGWTFAGPAPMPGDGGEYFVARIKGRDVAGIGSQPAADAPRRPTGASISGLTTPIWQPSGPRDSAEMCSPAPTTRRAFATRCLPIQTARSSPSAV
jgi:hypothetical protein